MRKTSRALPSSSRQGDVSPWIPVFLGVMGVWDFGSCLAGYSPQSRAPAYPFFRKEKIQLHRRRRRCDAESPERVLLRSYSLRGGSIVRRSESPSQGYRLAAASLPCPGRSFGTSNKGEKTAVGPEGRRWWKDSHGRRNPPLAHTDRKHYPRLCRNSCAAQELPRTQGGAFFFT